MEHKNILSFRSLVIRNCRIFFSFYHISPKKKRITSQILFQYKIPINFRLSNCSTNCDLKYRFYTILQLKHSMIHLRAVMLCISLRFSEQIVSHKRSTTLLRVANISFRKPRLRSSFHICSIGFISGV